MYKLLSLLGCVALLLTQTNCGTKTQEVVRAVNGGTSGSHGGGLQNKEELHDTAPTFVESQLKKGQWIEWKRTSPQGTSDCMRWDLTKLTSAGVNMESRISKDCQSYDNSWVEYFLFNSGSGVVSYIYGVVQGPEGPAQVESELKLKTIFNHLYGSKQKVTFKKGSQKIGTNEFPAFQLKDQPQVFLDQPETPFHAFVISWSENLSDGKWSYELNRADPPILPNPTNP